MGIAFSNNGSTTLNGGINDSTTSVVVTATASFPTVGGGDYFYATLIKQDGTREIVKCTSLSSQTYTVVRGADGSTPAAFSSGDRFQLRCPSIVLEEFRDDIATNATDLAGTTNAGTVPAPSGTNMFFYQAAAPTNWTIYTTVEDCLLSVKGGSNAYNIAGGTGAEAGAAWGTFGAHVHGMNSHTHGFAHTHGQAAHIHTMPTHWHTLSAHTHTGPSHDHTFSDSFVTGQESAGSADADGSGDDFAKDNHTHSGSVSGTTGADGTGNTGVPSSDWTNTKDPGDTNPTDAGSTNSQSAPATDASVVDTESAAPGSTDRPLAAVGILATKD